MIVVPVITLQRPHCAKEPYETNDGQGEIAETA